MFARGRAGDQVGELGGERAQDVPLADGPALLRLFTSWRSLLSQAAWQAVQAILGDG